MVMATKINVYLKEDIANDMKLLIKHEEAKITDFVNTPLKKYIESKAAELELARKQKLEKSVSGKKLGGSEKIMFNISK